MCKHQPPSDADAAIPSVMAFIVGQDAQGLWLALETHGLSGGIFKTRADAIRFADTEVDHRPGAVAVTTNPLRLTF